MPDRTQQAIRLLVVALGMSALLAAGPGLTADRQAAPGFSLQDVAGEQHSLREHLGKVVLINFWAASCPPCVYEMPALERLYRLLKDEGFVVVAVSGDETGSRAVMPVIDRLDISFPVLLDNESQVAALYGVSVRPTTYLVDRRGLLVTRIVGIRDWTGAEQLAAIRSLMRSESAQYGDKQGVRVARNLNNEERDRPDSEGGRRP